MLTFAEVASALYARYLCSRDALGLKASQAWRASIGYLVLYKPALKQYVSEFCTIGKVGTRNNAARLLR